MKLKELVKKHFSKDELKNLKTSFDVIGNVAILEIPKEIQKKEKILANALLKGFPNIKTIVKKIGIHYGRVIAGVIGHHKP